MIRFAILLVSLFSAAPAVAREFARYDTHFQNIVSDSVLCEEFMAGATESTLYLMGASGLDAVFHIRRTDSDEPHSFSVFGGYDYYSLTVANEFDWQGYMVSLKMSGPAEYTAVFLDTKLEIFDAASKRVVCEAKAEFVGFNQGVYR